MSARESLARVRAELHELFLERSELIDGALIALLASQHLLVIGPPGTAKSMLADEVCRRIAGASYFQWLLTRFTTPEELFGAVSLRALEADDYRRLTTHKLPEAHIAFLDEVFKANSSILNAILTVLNERRFHNGREVVRVPLITLFGAANELPEDDELAALHDRFLLRFVVGYIAEDFRFLKMLQMRPPSERTRLTMAELVELQADAAGLPVPPTVLRALAELRRALGRKEIIASDRRYRQAIGALQAHALLAGRDAVAEEDLAILEHILWRDPGERDELRATLRELLHGYEDEAQALLYQSQELRDYALRSWDTPELGNRAAIEAHTKLRRILRQVDTILEQARLGGRPLGRVEAARREIERIQQQMLAKL